MPYVPSEKTIPPAEDRKIIDAALEPVAQEAATLIISNAALLPAYKSVFMQIAQYLTDLASKTEAPKDSIGNLARAIFETGEKWGYEGAFLGELNYAMTRFIQRVPGIMVELGKWKEKDELRYWLYARTVSALIYASRHTENYGIGIDGVFEDIKDEYKRRVNTAYEAEQIVKSGDCYDAPYFTRLVEVVDDSGHVGYMEIMLKRTPMSSSRLRRDKDVLNRQIKLE